MNTETVKSSAIVSNFLLEWLGESDSYRTSPVKCTIDGISPGVYVINIIKINNSSLYVQEIISSDLRGQVIFRAWSFEKKSIWKISEIEKYETPIAYHRINEELKDFLQRIQVILAVQVSNGTYFSDALNHAEEILKVTLPNNAVLKRSGPFNRLNVFFYRYFALVSAGIITIGMIGIILVYSTHLYSFKRKVETSLQDYSKTVDLRTKGFFHDTEKQISTLVDKLKKNQESFDFDRKNAYINVLRMGEELTKYFPARKKAYRLISNNILQAANYSEILYDISRLPTEEYQARIFLATDRSTVTPLASWKPVFASMVYPVKLDNTKNDGRGFRITDGYMAIRENPLGSGGASPHYAVDIINVSNIAYVDNAGIIVREGNPPGNIVAAFAGTVIYTGWDNRYGNHILLKHKLTEEVKKKYPRATGWGTYYAHMKAPSSMKPGEIVQQNQIIGQIGDTGHSTGPHLHFEVHIYEKTGVYKDSLGRFNKINPFPGFHIKKSKKL